MNKDNSICDNILQLRKNIEEISKPFPLKRQDIKLIAVSKNQDVTKIKKAIRCGQIDFAENYLQEAESKWVSLKKEYPYIKLHLIGNLQKNKVKKALYLFDYIHTLDSFDLARKIAKIIQEEKLKDKSFLIQILLDEHSITKHGLHGNNLDKMLIECKNLNLDIVGLMGVAPLNAPPAPFFAYLHHLVKQNNLKDLSMGMSNDYMVAVRFGSSMLRLGTAIFGAREEIK